MMTPPMRLLTALVGTGLVAVLTTTSAATSRFLSDDPLTREPETQDAAGVKEWEIDLIIDLAINLFARPGDGATNVRAKNVNTIDEVPDSNWFTNRIVQRPIAIDELQRGPLTGPGPTPGRWRVVAPKLAGFAPGFTMVDARGERWFVSFDAAGHPEAATGAISVANKIFWALGYWQVENHLIAVDRAQLEIAETAVFTPPSGRERRMQSRDLDAILERAHRRADGTYRAIAARAVSGRTIGPFKYYDTRPDDPNDVVPHEHRRELRALKVFGAWTNLVDLKAGNTLDTVITENGRSVVRHYLQDVGSTFGTGANGPREYDEGWELLYDAALLRKRLLTFNFFIAPWQTVTYSDVPAIGRFEGDRFDPLSWQPRVSTAALRHARSDDTFWAARRVTAFTDDMIRAVVATGEYSDPAAAAHLSDVLIKRRQKIAATYLPAINPVVDLELAADGRFQFRNAAVDAGVAAAPTGGYRVEWAAFDNVTGETQPLGPATASSQTTLAAPGLLPQVAGAVVRVRIAAIAPAPDAWQQPVDGFFRRMPQGWRLVGLDKHPNP
jgi:hypothetical protein